MEVSNAHHHQVHHMANHPLEEIVNGCSKGQEQDEKKLNKPQPEHSLKCPRCESTNTKFCYYNNYSLSQPRYFCKGCRRYWTKGGSLRNVPVGGGCRKNRKSSSSSSSSSSKSRPHDHILQPFTSVPNPHPALPAASTLLPPLLAYDPNDFSLALTRLQKQPHSPGTPPYLLSNPNLDILAADHIPSCGGSFPNLYCGYNDTEEVLVPHFEGAGFSGATATATATAATTVTTTTISQVSSKDFGADQGEDVDKLGSMELQWQAGADCNVGSLEHSGREHYWINGVGSNWQSLINSSLL